MCMQNTQNQIRMGNTMSGAFELNTGLKQEDTLSPMLFNIELEKAIIEMHKEPTNQMLYNYRGAKYSGAWVCRRFKNFRQFIK